jgi:hypothetical protein
MTPELAISLADIDHKDDPIQVRMKAANDIFKKYSNDWKVPFSQTDIIYAEFTLFVATTGTQREIDLIVVSNTLGKAWSILHITMKTLKDDITPGDEQDLRSIVPALDRLNMLHLLTDGLPKKLVKFVNSFKEKK